MIYKELKSWTYLNQIFQHSILEAKYMAPVAILKNIYSKM